MLIITLKRAIALGAKSAMRRLLRINWLDVEPPALREMFDVPFTATAKRLQQRTQIYVQKKKLQISVTGLNWVKTITKKKKKIIGDVYRAVGRLTDREEKLQKLVFIFFCN